MTILMTSTKATAAAFIFCTCHVFSLAPPPWYSMAPVSSSSDGRNSSLRHRSHLNVETPLFHSASTSTCLNPLLASFLLRSVRKKVVVDPAPNLDATIHSQFTFSDASKAMAGLSIWETSFRKARLPVIEDFPKDQGCWPDEPLFTHVFSILTQMGLPRLVSRHPEITTSILLGLAKIVVDFITVQRRGKLVLSRNAFDQEDDKHYSNENNLEELDDESESDTEFEPLAVEEVEKIAVSLANNLGQEWGGMVQGVAQLDKVFGYDHGLLDLQVIQSCNC